MVNTNKTGNGHHAITSLQFIWLHIQFENKINESTPMGHQYQALQDSYKKKKIKYGKTPIKKKKYQVWQDP